MASPSAASKVFMVTLILCVVPAPPAESEDAENEDDCSAPPAGSGTDCPAGYRLYILEGETVGICILCEKGSTHRPEPSRCQKCLACSVCPDGYREKESCERTRNTTCELIPVTTAIPTTALTPGTTPTQRLTKTPTRSAGEDDTTPGLIPTREQLQKGEEWKTIVMVVLGVLLVTAATVIMYQRYRIRQLRTDRREQDQETGVAARASERPVSQTQVRYDGETAQVVLNGTTPDPLASEEGSDRRLLEEGAAREPNGNAYAIADVHSTDVE